MVDVNFEWKDRQTDEQMDRKLDAYIALAKAGAINTLSYL